MTFLGPDRTPRGTEWSVVGVVAPVSGSRRREGGVSLSMQNSIL